MGASFLPTSKSTLDLVGKTLGSWYVVRQAPTIVGTRYWCRHLCGAGGEKLIDGSALKRGRAPKHCGQCRPGGNRG